MANENKGYPSYWWGTWLASELSMPSTETRAQSEVNTAH